MVKDLAADHGLATEADVMRLRGVAKRTLSNERSQGGGPPFVRMGKKVYYPLEGLREYIAAHTVTPSSTPTLIDSRKARTRRKKSKTERDATAAKA